MAHRERETWRRGATVKQLVMQSTTIVPLTQKNDVFRGWTSQISVLKSEVIILKSVRAQNQH